MSARRHFSYILTRVAAKFFAKKSEMVVVSFSRDFEVKIFVSPREYFYTSHKSSLSRARAHAHIKHHFFVRARPTCARKSQTWLSSIDLSIDDRGWKGGSSFLHRLLSFCLGDDAQNKRVLPK